MKYSARDQSGNEAEEVWVSLVLHDLIAPVISTNHKIPDTLEASDVSNPYQIGRNFWAVPKATAIDNIDGDVTGTVKISVVSPSKKSLPTLKLDTSVVGEWSIRYTANDYAGMFGLHSENNVATEVHLVTVTDSTPHICILTT